MADINPRSRLQWTNCEAPQPAKTIRDNLYLEDGITPKHRTQFPAAEPGNHFTPMKGPAETARMTVADWFLAGALVMVLVGAGYMLVGN